MAGSASKDLERGLASEKAGERRNSVPWKQIIGWWENRHSHGLGGSINWCDIFWKAIWQYLKI